MPSRKARNSARRSGTSGVVSASFSDTTSCSQTPPLTTAVGTVSVLGGFPAPLLQQSLRMLSLYEVCIVGAACKEMKGCVVTMGLGLPLTHRFVEEHPDALVTPVFRSFLSLLLEFHLPVLCRHANVLYQSSSDHIAFACQHCRRAIRYKKSMSVQLCCVAFCTTIRSDKDLRLRCLRFIRNTEAPVIGMIAAANSLRQPSSGVAMDLSQGIVNEIALKDNVDTVTGPTVSSPKVELCQCEACRRPSGGDISDHEFGQAGDARTGRQKTRKGTRASRLHRTLHMDTCENDHCRNGPAV